MIQLKVEDYCHEGCTYFEPKITLHANNYPEGNIFRNKDTVIRCEHRHMCEYMRKYLDRKEESK